MKKKVIIFGILILALMLVACGKTSSPEKTASNYVEAVLALDVSEAANYVVEGSQEDDYIPAGIARDFASALFPYIELDSVNVEEESDAEATVEIVIAGPDIEALQTAAMEQGLEIYLADPDISQEDLNQKVVEYFTKSLDKNDQVKSSVSVGLVKTDDAWLLTQDSQAAILAMLISSLGPVEIVTE